MADTTVPPYADIWAYLYPLIGTAPGGGANGQGTDVSQQAAGTWTQGYYTTDQQGGGEGGTTDVQTWHPGVWTPSTNIPDKYKGMLLGYDNSTETAQSGPSEDSQLKYNTDLMSKLPSTKFGPFTTTGIMSLGTGASPDWGALGGNVQGVNKSLTYFDPNYGWITPSTNVVDKENSFIAQVPNLLEAAAGAAFGYGLGFPSLAIGGTKAIGNVSNGGDPIAQLLALLGSASGIPGAGTLGGLAGGALSGQRRSESETTRYGQSPSTAPAAQSPGTQDSVAQLLSIIARG